MVAFLGGPIIVPYPPPNPFPWQPLSIFEPLDFGFGQGEQSEEFDCLNMGGALREFCHL